MQRNASMKVFHKRLSPVSSTTDTWAIRLSTRCNEGHEFASFSGAVSNIEPGMRKTDLSLTTGHAHVHARPLQVTQTSERHFICNTTWAEEIITWPLAKGFNRSPIDVIDATSNNKSSSLGLCQRRNFRPARLGPENPLYYLLAAAPLTSEHQSIGVLQTNLLCRESVLRLVTHTTHTHIHTHTYHQQPCWFVTNKSYLTNIATFNVQEVGPCDAHSSCCSIGTAHHLLLNRA